ncbi:MAG: hypothetical protein AAGA67_04010 [Cyanobacteria bacterium P01_F01_bin.153]
MADVANLPPGAAERGDALDALERIEWLLNRLLKAVSAEKEDYSVPSIVSIFPKPPAEKIPSSTQMFWVRQAKGENGHSDHAVAESCQFTVAGQCVSGRLRALHLSRIMSTRDEVMIYAHLSVQVSASLIYRIGLGNFDTTVARMCLMSLRNANVDQLRKNVRVEFTPGTTDDRVVFCSVQDSLGEGISCDGASEAKQSQAGLEEMVWGAFMRFYSRDGDDSTAKAMAEKAVAVVRGELQSTESGDEGGSSFGPSAAPKPADELSPVVEELMPLFVELGYSGTPKETEQVIRDQIKASKGQKPRNVAGYSLGLYLERRGLAGKGLGTAMAREWLTENAKVKDAFESGNYASVTQAIVEFADGLSDSGELSQAELDKIPF